MFSRYSFSGSSDYNDTLINNNNSNNNNNTKVGGDVFQDNSSSSIDNASASTSSIQESISRFNLTFISSEQQKQQHNKIDVSYATPLLSSYYIKCKWNNNGSFDILLTDTKSIWNGHISINYIENILKPDGMKTDHYVSLIKKALITQDQSGTQFTYRLRQSNSKPNNLEFTINIKLDNSELSLKSSLILSKVTNHSTANLEDYFNWLIGKVDSLSDHNLQLNKQNDSLQTQFNESIDIIKQLTSEKQSMELDLFGKFVIILNEKKHKIKELTNQLKQQQREMNSLQTKLKSVQSLSPKKQSGKLMVLSQSPPSSPSSQQQDSSSSLSISPKSKQQQQYQQNTPVKRKNQQQQHYSMTQNSMPSLDLLTSDDNYLVNSSTNNNNNNNNSNKQI
ncbi:putative DNA repair protein XRCC4 [Cavenderia fasciculata]|uniref:DNA repair protein XRCC4 n=1 Tax=Cavenderia fasciculata TaxID=261658 RepID=F4PNE7_CACFS|nr:putative DNA repair protein XRCC4 [Cavenderia fasciculata]EGG23000.1 putative DNA repair protein XRCC4 [Cavenderia fasciculata]|eukprot:XP_004360851.1 putative DNA repair protein XRCC4 [Cavenderia fasciculata]